MAGQIISRGKSVNVVRVYMGTDSKGKRIYHNKTIHGNKKVAQAYLNKVLREKDTGDFFEPSKELLSDYLQQWLKTAARPRLRDRTYSDYEDLIKRYINPRLGDNRLTQLTPMKIQEVYNAMTEQGLSSRTVRYTHNVLRNALEQAVKWQMLQKNPAQHVDLPRQEKKEMRAMSPEEAKRFLEAALFSRWGVLFELMITTGLRPGEAYGLKWADIDFENSRLHVQRALSRTKGAWKLEEPKTKRSKRSIPIPKSVVMSLKGHKKVQSEEIMERLKKEKKTCGNCEKWEKSPCDKKAKDYSCEEWLLKSHNFVFAALNGEPMDQSNVVNKYFKPLLKEAKLPETIRLYDLRHTCATLLLSAGENPKVVSERLGHASITLTLDTYSHVLPDMQEAATDKLEKMLF